MKKMLPWIIAGVAAVWIANGFRPPRDRSPTFAQEDFGRLPAMFNGRFQPIDSIARNSLLQLREKQSIYLRDEKRTMSATEWLMEVMMKPEKADQRRTFRINHPEVVSLLKLPPKDEQRGEDGKHYTWTQIEPSLKEMEAEGKRVGEIKKGQQSSYERALIKLQNRLFLYMRLKNTLQPENTVDFAKEVADYEKSLGPGLAAVRAREAGKDFDKAAFTNLLVHLEQFDKLVQIQTKMEMPFLVPPHPGAHSRDEWMRTGDTLLEAVRGEPIHQSVLAYAQMSSAYRQAQPAAFNKALADYRAFLGGPFSAETRKAGSEHYFNHLQSFYKASILYVMAFLLACGFWFNLNEGLRRSAWWLVVLALGVHTTGLLFRMILEGRPHD